MNNILGAMMVFVVDDDKSVRKALARLLKSAGVPARAFASGEELLLTEKSEQPDCMIVDIQMPGMNGFELCEKLKQSGSQVPVIFMTAFDDDRSRTRARDAGAIAYFRKPIDDQVLLDSISSATNQ